MSSHSSHTGHADSSSNEDGVNIKKIIAVGVVSLVIFGISSVVAAVIINRDEAEYQAAGEAPKPAHIGQEEIGLVDQVTFDGDHRLETWQAERKQRLESYGWADKKKRLVHIPIEEAMKEVVRQAGGGGGGQ